MMHIEAVCGDCGETFLPGSFEEADLEHYQKADETPCGGVGEISRLVYDNEDQLMGELLRRLLVGPEGMPPLAFRPIPRALIGILGDDLPELEGLIESLSHPKPGELITLPSGTQITFNL